MLHMENCIFTNVLWRNHCAAAVVEEFDVAAWQVLRMHRQGRRTLGARVCQFRLRLKNRRCRSGLFSSRFCWCCLHSCPLPSSSATTIGSSEGVAFGFGTWEVKAWTISSLTSPATGGCSLISSSVNFTLARRFLTVLAEYTPTKKIPNNSEIPNQLTTNSMTLQAGSNSGSDPKKTYTRKSSKSPRLSTNNTAKHVKNNGKTWRNCMNVLGSDLAGGHMCKFHSKCHQPSPNS